MKKVALLVASAVVLTIAGCSSPAPAGMSPVALASARPSASPTHTPVPSNSGATTATPIATPPASGGVDGPGAVMPDPTEAPVDSAPSPEPAPAPAPAVDPNAVDPAAYPSHAWDTGNNVALKGVEFMTADGNIICGIRPSDAWSGWAVCTPSTWKDIIPQDAHQPPIHAVEVDQAYRGASYLFPDLYSQPARTIPVLPDGKNITLENITCSVSGVTVTCTNFVYHTGFTVSTTAITMHN